MPRGVKREINYEEELQRIDMRITRHKNAIQELQEKRREMIREKEQKEISALYEAVKASGKPIGDLIAEIAPPKQTGVA